MIHCRSTMKLLVNLMLYYHWLLRADQLKWMFFIVLLYFFSNSICCIEPGIVVVVWGTIYHSELKAFFPSSSQRQLVHIEHVSAFSNEARITLRWAESSARDLRSEPASSIIIFFEGLHLQNPFLKMISRPCGEKRQISLSTRVLSHQLI